MRTAAPGAPLPYRSDREWQQSGGHDAFAEPSRKGHFSRNAGAPGGLLNARTSRLTPSADGRFPRVCACSRPISNTRSRSRPDTRGEPLPSAAGAAENESGAIAGRSADAPGATTGAVSPASSGPSRARISAGAADPTRAKNRTSPARRSTGRPPETPLCRARFPWRPSGSRRRRLRPSLPLSSTRDSDCQRGG